MKKLTVLLLALVMALSLGVTVSAASSDFTIENGVLTKYNGPGGDVVIPNGVTSIGNSAFGNCDSVTSVVIPNGVTSIGDAAFSNCTGLTSITIPNSVTKIGSGVSSNPYVIDVKNNVFRGCTSLESVTLPNRLTYLCEEMFYGCTSLKSITIPDSVTAIGDSAFGGCTGLTSVTIPGSVKSIGDSAFSRCTGLTSITIPDSVTTIGYGAFSGCTGLTSVTIPDGVTTIDNHTFADCDSLTSVTIPNSVTTIDNYAFSNCTSLTSITIPDGVTSIGWYAFGDCTGLTSIAIPDSVTEIHGAAFGGCSNLKDVYYGGSEAQWSAIDFKTGNESLLTANIHYNSPMPEPPKPVETVGQFTDVPASQYYAQPVLWAVDKGITSGTSSTTFSPDATCTNAHILTFLYRAAGSPQVEAQGGVANVTANNYYYNSANWANSLGMIDVAAFDPSAPCTRASTVMFLWQAAGSPTVDATTKFTDVPAGADYAMAVAWALENGVTSGTSSTTFSPDATCTRGQIVTFLHRWLVE